MLISLLSKTTPASRFIAFIADLKVARRDSSGEARAWGLSERGHDKGRLLEVAGTAELGDDLLGTVLDALLERRLLRAAFTTVVAGWLTLLSGACLRAASVKVPARQHRKKAAPRWAIAGIPLTWNPSETEATVGGKS